MRHKHADMIIEWAEAGKPVQARNPEHLGTDWTDCKYPSWHEHIEYRFKPEELRYKRYLVKSPSGYIRLSIYNEGAIQPNEDHSLFVRWIDTEWQEVEV